jgi:hypothetical protein
MTEMKMTAHSGRGDISGHFCGQWQPHDAHTWQTPAAYGAVTFIGTYQCAGFSGYHERATTTPEQSTTTAAPGRGGTVKVYIDTADWWVGYYRGPNHHYVCPLPTVVMRWPRAATQPTPGADR